MGLTVLQDYYRDTLLDQLQSWFDPSHEKQWVPFEQSMILNRELKSLLLAKVTQQPLHVTDHLQISATLASWYYILKKQKVVFFFYHQSNCLYRFMGS